MYKVEFLFFFSKKKKELFWGRITFSANTDTECTWLLSRRSSQLSFATEAAQHRKAWCLWYHLCLGSCIADSPPLHLCLIFWSLGPPLSGQLGSSAYFNKSSTWIDLGGMTHWASENLGSSEIRLNTLGSWAVILLTLEQNFHPQQLWGG